MKPSREAGTVRESVTIWYRGAGYQLGRGQLGYAIWPAGGPPAQPLEQWPETPAGWSAAWSRKKLSRSGTPQQKAARSKLTSSGLI